jgi:molybdenum cofactor cytidylyltransferase
MLDLTQALRLTHTPHLALVGAGGKTTALFRLARELPAPVLVTATTHLATSQIGFSNQHIILEKPDDLSRLQKDSCNDVILITGAIEENRTSALSMDKIKWLHEFADSCHYPLLIEADGSRQRPFKAPSEHEPPIPTFADTVIVVAGLSGLGKPLTDEWVHRPNIFSRVSQLAIGQTITTDGLLHALTHPEGGIKNIPQSARRAVLLNQADTPDLQAQSRALVEGLLPTFDTAIIATLKPQLVVHAVHEPVAGIILAAGESRRFGRPKQLLDWHGQPFVRAIAQTALAAKLTPILVVTGSDAAQIEAVVKDLPVKILHNREWQSGQSSSIRAGLRAVPKKNGAVIFLLADQPQVTPQLLRAMVERHAANLPAIIAPTVGEQRATPVLFDRTTFPDLQALTGDMGGRAIFAKFSLTYLAWHDENLLLDVDTSEDYERLKRQA